MAAQGNTNEPAAVPGGTVTRATEPLSILCGDVARVLRRALGRGPRKVVARWAGRSILLVLTEDAPTDAEQTLRAAGYDADVRRARRRLYEIVEAELAACVERAVGRRVSATLTATRLGPDLSAAIFLLEDDGHELGERDDASRMPARAGLAVSRAHELHAAADALAAQSRQGLSHAAWRRRQRAAESERDLPR